MSNPVSIIITNYNYGQYLGEAISSALSQTYPAVEVIVIDDGSSDNSIEVACQYPVTVLQQENQGVCAARNNAATHASGKYLLFLDADDTLLPEAIADLVGLLESAPDNIAFAYGQAQYFENKSHVFESRPFDPQALAKENYIQVSALIKKSAFEAVGGFDRGFALREDWELFSRFVCQGYSGIFLGKPHFRYRKHKAPTRGGSKLPKRLSIAKLITAHPRFFLAKLLKNPLRYLILRMRFNIPQSIRHYGPTSMLPKTIQAPHQTGR
ncbi:MAG: glycosyltransferase family 2 protein [Hahellaceae bacterium]|nr:glycosyltransferase family 2 protein [Hahellaceae bacterium]MCP5168644.1 glycosyltransferase family 2 protein [Hahellaceae bacterium]